MRAIKKVSDEDKKQAIYALESARSGEEKLVALNAASNLLSNEGKLDEAVRAIAKTIGVPRAIAPESDELEGDLAEIFERRRTFQVKPRIALASDGFEVDEWGPAASPEEANCWSVIYDTPYGQFPNAFVGTFLSKAKAEAVAEKLRELNVILAENE